MPTDPTTYLQQAKPILDDAVRATHANEKTDVGSGILVGGGAAVTGAVTGAAIGGSAWATTILTAAGAGASAGPIGLAAGAAIGAVISLVTALVAWKGANDAARAEQVWQAAHNTTVGEGRQIVAWLRMPGNEWILKEPNGPYILERASAIAQIPLNPDWREYLNDPTIYATIAAELSRQGYNIDDPAVRARLGLPPLREFQRLSSARAALNNPTAMNALLNPLARVRKTNAADVARRSVAAFGSGDRRGVAMLAAPMPARGAAGQGMSAPGPRLALGAAVAVGAWYFLRGR
jgi:hypothetical protein